MTQIEDYLKRCPQETQRILGIDGEQFQELVKQAELLQARRQQEKPRLIKAGGRRRQLSVKQEILLTLVYLNQFPTFQEIQRPSDPQQESKYYSKYKARHTLKNQVIVTPNGSEIVDGVVGRPSPTSDLRIWRERATKFLEDQGFQGDTAYLGEATRSTPNRKPKHGKLTPEEKESKGQKARQRIRVEHLIRRIKIFRITSERFRLHLRHYNLIITLVQGLVRYRVGSFIFS